MTKLLGEEMTNYVFVKFYKTKCGRKVVCTGYDGNNYCFTDEHNCWHIVDDIESEWQDEKPLKDFVESQEEVPAEFNKTFIKRFWDILA